jgi:hypothetical protein
MPSTSLLPAAMRRLFMLAGLAAATLLVGCGSIQNVPIKDTNAPGGAVRATFRGLSGEPARRLGAGIEVGYEGYRPKGTQSLAAGESVLLLDATFTGPQDLRHEASLRQFYVAYNHRFGFGPHLEFEPYVGVTQVWAKVLTTPASGNRVTAFDERSVGVTAGFTPRWRFNDRVAVELRYNFFGTRLDTTGISYEAMLVLSPAEHVALRLGWTGRNHTISDNFPVGITSEIDVRTRGPMASLQFDF